MFGLLLIYLTRLSSHPLVLSDTSIVQYLGFARHTMIINISSFSGLNSDVTSSNKPSMTLRLDEVLYLSSSL